MTDTRPVGILDSGFGGLSVARAVADAVISAAQATGVARK